MARDCCKVARCRRENDLRSPDDALDDLDDYLVARWRGEAGYDETGVRGLVDWFNRYVVRETYIEHGRRVTNTRIESEYDALTSDDEAVVAEVVDDLARDGIDGAALRDSFPSRSTMARHLRDCLGAQKDTSATGDWERDSIEHSRESARDHVSSVLETLANKGRLPGADEAILSIPVYLACPDCSRRVDLEEALERGYICETHLGTAADAPHD